MRSWISLLIVSALALCACSTSKYHGYKQPFGPERQVLVVAALGAPQAQLSSSFSTGDVILSFAGALLFQNTGGVEERIWMSRFLDKNPNFRADFENCALKSGVDEWLRASFQKYLRPETVSYEIRYSSLDALLQHLAQNPLKHTTIVAITNISLGIYASGGYLCPSCAGVTLVGQARFVDSEGDKILGAGGQYYASNIDHRVIGPASDWFGNDCEILRALMPELADKAGASYSQRITRLYLRGK